MLHQYNSGDEYAYSEFLLNKCLEFQHLDKDLNIYGSFSHNKALTFDTVLKRPNEKWQMRALSENPNITWEIVQDSRSIMDWKFGYLSCNPNITWEIVRENENEDWDYGVMGALNPNITCDIIEDFPQYNWSWWFMHKNKNLTPEFIENNIDKSWNFRELSKNPNITLDLVLRNRDKMWYSSNVADNPILSWEEIQSNLDFFGTDIESYLECPHTPWDIYYKTHTWFDNDSLHIYRNLTIENIANCNDTDNKIDQRFTAIDYNTNDNFQRWDLIEYMIGNSYGGPVKENNTFDKFCDMVAYDALRDVFDSFDEVISDSFFNKTYMSFCEDTTWIEVEKYLGRPSYYDGWKLYQIAENHMPRYKELFLEGKV